MGESWRGAFGRRTTPPLPPVGLPKGSLMVAVAGGAGTGPFPAADACSNLAFLASLALLALPPAFRLPLVGADAVAVAAVAAVTAVVAVVDVGAGV